MGNHRADIEKSARVTPANFSRRDFLRYIGRLAWLGMGALGILFFMQRKQVGLSGQRCLNDGVCVGCGSYRDCGLPAAMSRRKALLERD